MLFKCCVNIVYVRLPRSLLDCACETDRAVAALDRANQRERERSQERERKKGRKRGSEREKKRGRKKE